MLGATYHAWAEDWELRHKVDFDGANRLIRINRGETEIDVQEDIYESWKEWKHVRDNAKYPQALSSVGGDPTVGGATLGTTVFLETVWRIVTWEGDHRLQVNGNLYTRDGSSSFVPVPGYSIVIEQSVSNLVDDVTVTGDGLTSEQAASLLNIEAGVELGLVELQDIDAAISSMSALIVEVHKIQGLDAANSLIVSATQRIAGAISQSISEAGDGTITVQRT